MKNCPDHISNLIEDYTRACFDYIMSTHLHVMSEAKVALDKKRKELEDAIADEINTAWVDGQYSIMEN